MALSSRAHAFSVEALVGKGSKRKLPQGPEEGRRDSPGRDPVRDPVRDAVREPQRDRSLGRQGEEEERPKAESSTAAVANGGEEREDIQMELQGSELWKRFYDIGTEMIITKAGRRMFPSVRVRVKGLDPGKQYCIAIDVVPVDSKRYRYVYHSSQWMVAGNTDHSSITPRLYLHPDSPCSGETWTRQIISFDRVKLTNNEMDDKGHIILQSMHKYKPRVHVIAQDRRFDCSQAQSLPAQGVKTFSFQETEFTTVTAYQNQQITKLKIDRNPFAKGFRDPGRNRGVLDGMMDGYPWRPHLSLDFKPFGADPSEEGTVGLASPSGNEQSPGKPDPRQWKLGAWTSPRLHPQRQLNPAPSLPSDVVLQQLLLESPPPESCFYLGITMPATARLLTAVSRESRSSDTAGVERSSTEFIQLGGQESRAPGTSVVPPLAGHLRDADQSQLTPSGQRWLDASRGYQFDDNWPSSVKIKTDPGPWAIPVGFGSGVSDKRAPGAGSRYWIWELSPADSDRASGERARFFRRG
ncbi:LOW QUALITY PROTEIN: T-box transcription factor TBX22 [Tachyglossus aculeatus]|uniref:LOW QUALITY PROTEIN: T-box transcription factor TBX22 n=1 Tax=Tachyglossus aculeatus TaxID=9261 RepID=UPI0018F5221E|nr:LOW QUALITY PROTEIN: T-box transcription factor TBX22 [Tachyglossus aculeatus]